MPQPFVSDRCLPWLRRRAGVLLDGAPQPIGPDVCTLRARRPPPAARRLRLVGLVACSLAGVTWLAELQPAPTHEPVSGHAIASTAGLGGLGLGALVWSRRFGRGGAPLEIVCLGRCAAVSDRDLVRLAAGARKHLLDATYPRGQIWLVSEAGLSPDRRALAGALGLRCFVATAADDIREV